MEKRRVNKNQSKRGFGIGMSIGIIFITIILTTIIISLVPTISLASGGDTDVVETGYEKFDPKLDIEDVVEIRLSKDGIVRDGVFGNEMFTLNDGDYIYVLGEEDTVNIEGVDYTYLKINLKDGQVGYIWSELTTYPKPIYVAPKTSSAGNDIVNSNSGGYQISKEVTAYCSACDKSGVTASGKPLAWGRVASNDFPIGTRLYVPNYGDCVVEDRMRDGGKVDVYIGDYEHCQCSSIWGSPTLTITVY